MPRFCTTQTSFAGGELDPRLGARTDLRVYAQGAARLRNVIIHPGGGLSRRPGLRHVDTVAGGGRLIAMAMTTTPACLLVLTDRHLAVYRQGAPVAGLATPWTDEQLRHINYTQTADTVLIVHPDVAPQQVGCGDGEDWHLQPLRFRATEAGRIRQPHHKFADAAVTLSASGTAAGATITLTASDAVFQTAHVGTRWRLRDREVEILSVQSPTGATAMIREALVDTASTRDWTEQAFSAVRGWPVAITLHQDRLVFGGSRALPNRLWLSRTGAPFDFDLGEGLDDQAIDFPLLSDENNSIRAVVSGRHLQVFTTGAEWMVTGSPLSPARIQVHRQTRVGSPADRTVAPVMVDGATIFIPRHDGQVREFLYADVEQAYQSPDLALASAHLVDRPVDMDYDHQRRLLHVVMGNGTVGTLTVYRVESVAAWSLQQTDGQFLAVAVVGDQVYALVARAGQVHLEAFDDRLALDAAVFQEAGTAQALWSGLGHLEGRTVAVVADGSVRPDAWVAAGAITLAEPAHHLQAGLPYTHVITPMPMAGPGDGASGSCRVHRPVAVRFRLHETSALHVDVGTGVRALPFRRFGRDTFGPSPPSFSGEMTVRILGWGCGRDRPHWSITQATPGRFTLLSVATEGITGE
ncbi:MAG: hypothetical protein EA405_07900 [Rhodospirillales bacterium]|nr:MAG: hypothetical protein EA405_07900 [Rhodospirillales bacterium]